MAERHDLLVITDEIYEQLVYGEHRHTAFPSLPGMRERTVLISGFSKSYAMTGWRIGYVAAPAALMAGIAKVHQYGIMCAPTSAQYAAIEALRRGAPYVAEMRAEYDRRRRLMTDRLNRMGLLCFEPKGAFYCFPNVTAATGLDDETFARELLTEERVAVVPGSAFGASGAGHVRMCYATAYEEIVEAMDRLEHFLAAPSVGAVSEEPGTLPDLLRVRPGTPVNLSEIDPDATPGVRRRQGRRSRSAQGAAKGAEPTSSAASGRRSSEPC